MTAARAAALLHDFSRRLSCVLDDLVDPPAGFANDAAYQESLRNEIRALREDAPAVLVLTELWRPEKGYGEMLLEEEHAAKLRAREGGRA